MKSKKSLYRIRKKIEKRAADLLIKAKVFQEDDWDGVNLCFYSQDYYGEGCVKDLEVDIKFMLEACSKPILKESDLPASGEYLSGVLHSNGLSKENGL